MIKRLTTISTEFIGNTAVAFQLLPHHPLRLKRWSYKHIGGLSLPCTVFVAMPKIPLKQWQKLECLRYVLAVVLAIVTYWVNGLWFVPVFLMAVYYFDYSKEVLASPYALPIPFVSDCVAVPLLLVDSAGITYLRDIACLRDDVKGDKITIKPPKQILFNEIGCFGTDSKNLFVFDHTQKPPTSQQMNAMTLLVLIDEVFYRLPMYELVCWLNEELLAQQPTPAIEPI